MTQGTEKKENRKRRRSEPLYECLECGRKFFTTRAAERAVNSDEGCPGCGGVDIDVYVRKAVA